MTSKRSDIWAKIVATSFGVGYFPFGPGTMGAALGVLIWLPFYLWTSEETLLLVTLGLSVVFTILGVWSGNVVEKYWGEDPSIAVMDETVGVWITLLPVTVNDSWWYVLLAFLLFRILDIWKPLGIRKLEKLPGGYGIMADDIAAAAVGIVIILIVKWILALC